MSQPDDLLGQSGSNDDAPASLNSCVEFNASEPVLLTVNRLDLGVMNRYEEAPPLSSSPVESQESPVL